MTQVDLVVARYNEDIHWVDDLAGVNRVFVYNKGKSPISANNSMIEEHLLSNVGRETHTYLNHIVSHWDSLANINIFFQGQINDRPEQQLLPFECYTSITSWGLAGKLDTCFEPFSWGTELDYISGISEYDISFGEFVVNTLGLAWRDKSLFSKGAYFSVGKDRIKLRPKAFYQNILLKHQISSHINPRVGHYMERSWIRLFGEV